MKSAKVVELFANQRQTRSANAFNHSCQCGRFVVNGHDDGKFEAHGNSKNTQSAAQRWPEKPLNDFDAIEALLAIGGRVGSIEQRFANLAKLGRRRLLE